MSYSRARWGGVCVFPLLFLLYLSRAHRAAGELASGAGEHYCAPHVALAAPPPDLFLAAGGDHLRRERTVEVLRPLRSDLRLLRREVVEPGQYAPPGAVRAAAAAGITGGDQRLILVPERTAPPDAAVAVRRDVPRGERGVFLRIPLRGQARIGGGEVVLAGRHTLAVTVGAAGALRARDYAGLPFVALFAAPPHLAAGACENFLRLERGVPLRVPLTGQGRMGGGEVVLARSYAAVCADRATAAVHAGFDRGAP